VLAEDLAIDGPELAQGGSCSRAHPARRWSA
jgi:hypothetical protein